MSPFDCRLTYFHISLVIESASMVLQCTLLRKYVSFRGDPRPP